MTMLLTVIALGLATVPIMASLSTQRGDQRDQASDAALAAADAGASIAISRQSQMAAYLSSSKPCVKQNGTKLEAVVAESGWCAAVGPVGIGEATYTYRVKPVYSTSGATISVISTGTATAGSRSVGRRLMVNANSASATPIVFGTEGVVGIDSIVMTNGNIYGDVGSNGNIEWPKGDAHITGCSRARVGLSNEFKKQDWQAYPCPIVKEKREYPDVILPTTTSNSRMFTSGGDTYTYSSGALAGCGASLSQSSWCPTTKVLNLTNDAAVTLGGTAPYLFCQLRMVGDAELIMAANAHIQIIFDSPESCKQSSGTTQMLVDDGAAIRSLSYSPSTGNFSVPGFYFIGSKTLATKILLDGGASGNNMIIYAPRTNIEVLHGALFGGAILGKTVLVEGGGRVQPEGTGAFKPDENLPVAGTGGSSTFFRGAYVECSAAATVAAEPASGC